ncbi:protein FAM237B-like [Pygocentrus nattereri]|uniref:protein FAM237B-like n=1 Tax=Pygocentrus nattereri TaxID=42514 RepID=UPI00189100DA|nr:protein FAM237B-like [Pygocentrus nattereri]
MDSRPWPLGVRLRRLAGMCVLLMAVASSCAMGAPNIMSPEAGRPVHLGEIDGACWDASSLAVIEVRKLHVADNVGSFWDFMTYLRASPQQGHQDAFMKLAQLFWERYVDCVLSRAHGLGRRAWRRATRRATL